MKGSRSRPRTWPYVHFSMSLRHQRLPDSDYSLSHPVDVRLAGKGMAERLQGIGDVCALPRDGPSCDAGLICFFASFPLSF
jgi:hypothetical protein